MYYQRCLSNTAYTQRGSIGYMLLKHPNSLCLALHAGTLALGRHCCRPETQSRDLHLQAYSLDGVSESLKKAYKLFTDGKFSNALQAFNQMLWTIPLVVVSSRKEVDEVKELITICRFATPASDNLIGSCSVQSCCAIEGLAISC